MIFLQLDYGNYNDKGPPHIVFFFYFIFFLASFFFSFFFHLIFLVKILYTWHCSLTSQCSWNQGEKVFTKWDCVLLIYLSTHKPLHLSLVSFLYTWIFKAPPLLYHLGSKYLCGNNSFIIGSCILRSVNLSSFASDKPILLLFVQKFGIMWIYQYLHLPRPKLVQPLSQWPDVWFL